MPVIASSLDAIAAAMEAAGAAGTAEDVSNNADSDAASDTAHGPSPATAPTRPKLTAGWSAAGGKLALVREKQIKNQTFCATSCPQQPPTV